jgi:hypothetical protein
VSGRNLERVVIDEESEGDAHGDDGGAEREHDGAGELAFRSAGIRALRERTRTARTAAIMPLASGDRRP